MLLNIIDLIIDNEYKELMKFYDVLYYGILPNSKIIKDSLSQKEKKKQQKGGIIGFGI